MIKLGTKVKDPITGFKGTTVSRCEFLNGCVRVGVQGPMLEGKVPNVIYFDESQLEKAKSKKKTGGPRPDPQRTSDYRENRDV